MKTINDVVDQLVSPQNVLRELKETLRTCDPEYREEEKRFLEAAERLSREVGTMVSPGSREYLAAREQELASDVIFAGWQGFALNLECFKNPVNKLRLGEDFESLVMEHQMPTLPMANAARATISAFRNAMPAEKKDLTDEIDDYYAYLQTHAYKLAHYFGFRLADQFLYYVIPGYVSEQATTMKYTRHFSDVSVHFRYCNTWLSPQK